MRPEKKNDPEADASGSSSRKIRVTIMSQGTAILWFLIYQAFHSTKGALRLVDSWSRVPDKIQIYPDRDTIAQLLPVCQIKQHMFLPYDCLYS